MNKAITMDRIEPSPDT